MPSKSKELAWPSNQKAHWLRLALATILEYTDEPTIVECGAMRFEDEVPSDGASTLYFSRWLRQIGGGLLYSLDTDRRVFDMNSARFESPFVQIVEMDGADFLKAFTGPIDLLYLDSVAEATLAQLAAALPNLHPQAIVVMDDSHEHDGLGFGKAESVMTMMRSDGWHLCEVPTEVAPDASYRMALWRKCWPVLLSGCP